VPVCRCCYIVVIYICLGLLFLLFNLSKYV
jgi:hypothetical protein